MHYIIHHRFLPILLTVVLIAQAVIAGWGHSHTHVVDGSHGHVAFAGHSHHQATVGGQFHIHHSQQHSPLPSLPADQDDCSVCRHLALAAILTLDLEALPSGDVVASVPDAESSLVSTIAVGLHRPRSPPELS
ncbi:MAG: hypothetical protein ABI614_24260 [Planctomycetota bacterium]